MTNIKLKLYANPEAEGNNQAWFKNDDGVIGVIFGRNQPPNGNDSIVMRDAIVCAVNSYDVMREAMTKALQDLVGTDGRDWQLAQLTLRAALALAEKGA